MTENSPRRPPDPGEPKLIAGLDDLDSLFVRLRGARRVALDTEAASFHRFIDRVYLVQLSSDTETAVIDPLAVADLSPLGNLLRDPAVETVFHDADYDLRILARDYGFTARNVWDTRIAAQLLGEPGIGLAALLEKYFAVRLDKKYQRADWSDRPLTPAMIAYAAADTAYLLALRDELERQLALRGRLSWAREEFGYLENLRWTPPARDEEGYLRIKGTRALSARAQAIARAVHDWRERTAEAMDRAPFRVLGNDQIVAIARAAPTNADAVETVPDFPRSIARRHGEELAAEVRRALALPESELPRPLRTPRVRTDPAVERRMGRLKDLRNQQAQALGVEPGVLCPNGTLLAIARVAPIDGAALRTATGLRKWQVEAIGEEEILKRMADGAA